MKVWMIWVGMHYHSLGNQKSIFIYKNNIFCLAVYTQTFVQQIGFVLDKVILENPMGGMKIVHCQDLHNILQNVTSIWDKYIGMEAQIYKSLIELLGMMLLKFLIFFNVEDSMVFRNHNQRSTHYQGPWKGLFRHTTLPKFSIGHPTLRQKNARHRHSKFIPKYSNYTKSTLDTVIFNCKIFDLTRTPLSRALLLIGQIQQWA